VGRNLTPTLLLAATATTGLLAGASLDQTVKQLPARRTIGERAFSRYSQASDLANGVAFYGALGIGAALLNVGAAVIGRSQRARHTAAFALNLGAALAVGHSLVSARAAPLNFSQRQAAGSAALAKIFDRFERLQAFRCVLQTVNFGVNLWALARYRQSI
jgi:hypothetical protein